MSSPSDIPPTLVLIGNPDREPLSSLLTAAGHPPVVVSLTGASSEGRRLLELAASPGPVIYAAWPEGEER